MPATRPAPRDRRDISPGRADARKRSRLIRERVRYRWIGYQRTLSRVCSVQQRSEGLGLNSELRCSVAMLSRRSDRLATVRSDQARPSTPSQRPREPSVEAARRDATRAVFPGHSRRHGTGSTPSRNRRAPPRSPRFRQRRQIANGNRMICRAFSSPLSDSNRRPLPYHDPAGPVGRHADPDLCCKYGLLVVRMQAAVRGFVRAAVSKKFPCAAPACGARWTHGDGSRPATAATSSRICVMTSAAVSASRPVTSRSARSSIVSSVLPRRRPRREPRSRARSPSVAAIVRPRPRRTRRHAFTQLGANDQEGSQQLLAVPTKPSGEFA